ncbi:MAG: hypothetical protein V1802_02100 [Candidatus Aenigmatarchaeota archaeon]
MSTSDKSKQMQEEGAITERHPEVCVYCPKHEKYVPIAYCVTLALTRDGIQTPDSLRLHGETTDLFYNAYPLCQHAKAATSVSSLGYLKGINCGWREPTEIIYIADFPGSGWTMLKECETPPEAPHKAYVVSSKYADAATARAIELIDKLSGRWGEVELPDSLI